MKKLFVFLLAVACGGSVVNVDGGSDGSNGGDGSNNQDGGGPFACGTTTCNGTQICVHPCCGGAMICAPLEDGGVCGPGLQITQTCPGTAPCGNVCMPAPPYCGTSSQCMGAVMGRDCYLVCA